jgi:hypothetical protein
VRHQDEAARWGVAQQYPQGALDAVLELTKRLPARDPVLRAPRRQVLAVVRLCPRPLRTEPELVQVREALRRPAENGGRLYRAQQIARHQAIGLVEVHGRGGGGCLRLSQRRQRPVRTVALLLGVARDENANPVYADWRSVKLPSSSS